MNKIFENIVVVDMTGNAAGPLCASYLADLGAEVIKVEKPGTGDDSRTWGPWTEEGESVLYMWHNRGKKSIVLDIKVAEDLEILKGLIAKADVLVESYKPGVMAKFNLDYENVAKINPNIIMCSISAFGQTGPYRALPGYDLTAQAMSGIVDLTGNTDGPPMRVGVSIADYVTGFLSFGSISAALFHRERTGEGQYVDMSLIECIGSCTEPAEITMNAGAVKTRMGNHHGFLAPYGVYNGKAGSIVIAANNQKLWSALCKLMGKEEYAEKPGFTTSTERCERLDQLIGLIEPWLDTFDDINEAEQQMQKAGIPCAKIKTVLEMVNDPHILAREFIREVQLPWPHTKTAKFRAMPAHYSKTPVELGVPPRLGEHRDEILKKYL